MKALIPLLFISSLVISCASAKWTVRDVSFEKREWRFCSEELDGVKKHEKGYCYISQECKSKKKCRPLPLFCAWGEIDCMRKYKLFQKKIR